MPKSQITAADVLDLFGYIILSAPDFPAEDETNVEREIAQLARAITAFRTDQPREDKRRRLDICLTELADAVQTFRSGDDQKGFDLIQSAEVHFKNALSGKSMKPSIYVDETGQEAHVEDVAEDDAGDKSGVH